MRLLARRLETDSATWSSTSAGQVALVAGLTGVGVAVGLAGPTLTGLGHAFASGAVHAGFLSAGWILALGGLGRWQGPAIRGSAALIVASLATGLSPASAVAFLLVPLVVARDAAVWHIRLERIGWRLPRDRRAPFVGAAAGIFLGIHLLFTASLMLGYPVVVPDTRRYLAALAYDIGANALTAEWLFRGVIFSALWRRWSFWPAAAAATGLSLMRYLLDPALPRTPELIAGAMFYMLLLGLGSCALRGWSGSLLPGYLATVAFFAAYRVLHV